MNCSAPECENCTKPSECRYADQDLCYDCREQVARMDWLVAHYMKHNPEHNAGGEA